MVPIYYTVVTSRKLPEQEVQHVTCITLTLSATSTTSPTIKAEGLDAAPNSFPLDGPFPPSPMKKAASGRPPGHGKRKTDQQLNKSVLPFHHTTPAWAAQAGKGSPQHT